MLEAIGAVLPYAVGIAISPIPIIATILMLMSKRPRALGLAFLVGWLIGVIVAVTVTSLLAELIPDRGQHQGPQPVLGTIQLLLGLALLALAVRRWLRRPKSGTEPALPAWMSKIETMKSRAAFGLAVLLTAVNPKNLLLAAAAGSVIGDTLVDGGTIVVAVIIFAVISTLSIAAPVVASLIAPVKARAVLDGIRGWLTLHNAAVMSVMMLLLGVQLIGKSFSSF